MINSESEIYQFTAEQMREMDEVFASYKRDTWSLEQIIKRLIDGGVMEYRPCKNGSHTGRLVKSSRAHAKHYVESYLYCKEHNIPGREVCPSCGHERTVND